MNSSVFLNSNRIHVFSFAVVNSKIQNMAAQLKLLESIQWMAVQIIFTDNDYMTTLAGLETLESRCAQLTERFFRHSVLCEAIAPCVHYLLPEKRDLSVTDRLSLSPSGCESLR